MNRESFPPRPGLSPGADLPAADPDHDDAALAERLRALAHPARLRVARALAAQDGCVCGAIVRTLPLAQSTVSQHLKVLLEAGLICVRSEGPRTAYCLDRDGVRALRDALDRVFSELLSPPGSGSLPPAGPEQED